MNRENIPPDLIDSKHISPRKPEKSTLKSPNFIANTESNKPLSSPADFNNSAQWGERNVVITSHQHQENTGIAQNIIHDLVDNLPCFENQASDQSPTALDESTTVIANSPLSINPSLTNSIKSDEGKDSGLEEPTDLKTQDAEELDDFSECIDSLPLDNPEYYSSPLVAKGCSDPLYLEEDEKKRLGQSSSIENETLGFDTQPQITKPSRATLSPDTLLELSEKSLGLPTDLSRAEVQNILDHLPNLGVKTSFSGVTSRLQSLTQEINDLLGIKTNTTDCGISSAQLLAKKPNCSPLPEKCLIEESVSITKAENFHFELSDLDKCENKATPKFEAEKSLCEEKFFTTGAEKPFLEEASLKSGPEKAFLEEASLRFDSEITFGEEAKKADPEKSLSEKSISKSRPNVSYVDEYPMKSSPKKSFVEDHPLKPGFNKNIVQETSSVPEEITLKFGTENFVAIQEAVLDKTILEPEEPIVEGVILKEPIVRRLAFDKSGISPKEIIEETSLDKSGSIPKEIVVEESSLDKSGSIPKEIVVEESSLDKSGSIPKEIVVEESSLDKSGSSPKEIVVEESSLDKSGSSPKEIVVEESSLDKFGSSPKEIIVEESSLNKSGSSPKEIVVEESSLDKSGSSPKEIVVEESSLDKSGSSPKEIVVEESSLNKSGSSPKEIVVEESSLDKSGSSPKEIVVEESSLNKSGSSPKEIVVEESSLDKSGSSPKEFVVEESLLDKSGSSPKQLVEESSLDKSGTPPKQLVVVELPLDKSVISLKELSVEESSLDKSGFSPKQSLGSLEPIAKEENLEKFEPSPEKTGISKSDQASEESVVEKAKPESPVTKEYSVLKEDSSIIAQQQTNIENTSQSVLLEEKVVRVDVPKEDSLIEKDISSPVIKDSILDTSQSLFIEKSGQLSICHKELILQEIAINLDCQTFSQLEKPTSNLQAVPSFFLPVTLDLPAPMPTPVAEAEREYQENGTSPVDTDYVNDNVQNNSFLISGNKPKMEFDENINTFENKCQLGSQGVQNENIIVSQTTKFESTEITKSSQCQKNPLPIPMTEPGEDIEKQKNLDEDEGITFDSEKENLVSAATAFEDYAENLDSGICDHIEAKFDGKPEADVGVAAVNRRTFRKSTPSLPVDSLPGSPSHSNLIHETLSGTSSPDLSLGASAPLINHSEAGPEVAQFTEDEFRSAAEVFKDPADFDFLLRAGSSKVLKESTLSRLSLYVKFDPLVKKEDTLSGKTPPVTGIIKEPEVALSKGSETLEKKTDQLDNTAREGKKNLNSSKLIEFDSPKNVKAEKTPPKMVPVEPVQRLEDNQTEPGKFFTEEDMKKALQIHDLLYQERLLKKEKEGSEKEQSFKAEIAELQRHVKLQAECISCTRKLLHETTRMSKVWREKKEHERVEQTKERDQALEDLQSVETAFGDLHKRYEKTKAVLEGYKQKENELREELMDCQEKLRKQEHMYEALRTRTEEQLDSANVEIESAKKSGSSELAVLSAQLKKFEMKVASLERTLIQKEQEYEELSRVYDDLIARFERT